MALDIKHGIYRSYTGSSQMKSGPEIAIAVIQGPSDAPSKMETHSALYIETRFKHSSGSRVHDALISLIVNKILAKYVVTDIDRNGMLAVSVYSNTMNLSLICNCVLVACLDGGIPLKNMFYCTGTDSLYVVEDGEVALCHSLGMVTEEHMALAKKEAAYIKESIEYGLRDMFVQKQ